MKLIERKPCGCKVYRDSDIPVEKLCKRHEAQVVREANKTLVKQGQPLL